MQAYLDDASTSPLRPEALAAMLPLLTEHFGNPSASNTPGRRARLVLDESRDDVADALGCGPGEVVFCSGGTEAAHLAVSGVISAGRANGPAIPRQAAHGATVMLCSAIEHPSVLRTVLAAGGATIPVGIDGVIDLDALAQTLGPEVSLVAVMLANNEVGTIQPITAVAELVRRHAPDALLFVDAVHAVPWLDVADLCSDADLVAVSAHKFGGPKGIGALIVRNTTSASASPGPRWLPPTRGGAQERERRPGTENVAGIAGMAAALRATVSDRASAVERIARLRDGLADALCSPLQGSSLQGSSLRGSSLQGSSLRGVTETGVHVGADGRPDRTSKVAGSCHLVIEGVEQDELLFLLDSEGVFASAGSACASGAAEPSHVLEAMGVSARLAESEAGFGAALRLSLGHSTSATEVEHALSVIPKVVEHLRAG